MRRYIELVGIVVAGACLGGAFGSVVMPAMAAVDADKTRQGVTLDDAKGRERPPRVTWSRKVAAASGGTITEIVFDREGILVWGYADTGKGESQSRRFITRMRLSDGETLWEHQFSGIPWTWTRAASENRVYLAAKDGMHILDRHSGKIIVHNKQNWSELLRCPSLLVLGKRVYLAMGSGAEDAEMVTLRALDHNGKAQWEKSLRLTGTVYLAADRSRVFAGADPDSKVIALSALKGDVLWQAKLPGFVWKGNEKPASAMCVTSAADDFLVIPAFGGMRHPASYMTALKAGTGTPLWKTEVFVGSLFTPGIAIDARRVFVGSIDLRMSRQRTMQILAFDRKTGKGVWRSPVLPSGLDAPFVWKNAVLHCAAGVLTGVSADTGAILWRIRLDREGTSSREKEWMARVLGKRVIAAAGQTVSVLEPKAAEK